MLEYFPRLGERLDQAGQNLSGGEQQMLALARGFLTRPALMLIDELSGGLMPMLVDALMDILRRINADGVTILLVEQELDVALALASRCYVLDQGRIQFEGASESLRSRPRRAGALSRRHLTGTRPRRGPHSVTHAPSRRTR